LRIQTQLQLNPNLPSLLRRNSEKKKKMKASD